MRLSPPLRQKKRILQFVSSFHVGGTERHVANLVRHHDRERFEFRIGCFSSIGGLLPDDAISRDDVTEYPLHRLYGFGTWRQQARLAQYLRTERIDLIHTYGFYANCFAIPAAFLARVPVIVASIRDVGASWSARQLRTERWICGLANTVLTNARAVKNKLVADGYDAGRISVIHNGIDPTPFQHRPLGGDLRRELGIAPDSPLVGVIARIDAVKGLDYFAEAAALVSERIPEARFVIIGDTRGIEPHLTYRRDLERKVRELGLTGKLILAGSRADVPEILPEMSLSVLPSLTEGLPNVVLESMAAGVPVVATDVGGTPEIVEHGVNGMLVPARDPRRMADCIEQLLRDRRQADRLAANGAETVTSRFSIDRMVRATEALYVDLLEGRTLPADLQSESRRSSGPHAATIDANMEFSGLRSSSTVLAQRASIAVPPANET